jgi:hypothetical protein
VRMLTLRLAAGAVAAAALTVSVPAASAGCVSAPGSTDPLIEIWKPVHTRVNDPGTISVSPADCINAAKEALETGGTR